jgi:hypothetical protein
MLWKARKAFPELAAGALALATKHRFGQRQLRPPMPLGSSLPSAAGHAALIQRRPESTLMPSTSDKACETDGPRTIVVRTVAGTYLKVYAKGCTHSLYPMRRRAYEHLL